MVAKTTTCPPANLTVRIIMQGKGGCTYSRVTLPQPRLILRLPPSTPPHITTPSLNPASYYDSLPQPRLILQLPPSTPPHIYDSPPDPLTPFSQCLSFPLSPFLSFLFYRIFFIQCSALGHIDISVQYNSYSTTISSRHR